MKADSQCVAVRHFFAYVKNAYCGEIDILDMELTTSFIDQLEALRDRFKAYSFLMRPARFVDVSPADLQRLVVSMCPGLSHFQCTSENITPAHVNDQLLDTLASNGVNSAIFRSLDKAVYFDVSNVAIVRFCFGASEAKRDLIMENVHVTQSLFDRLVEAHLDSSVRMHLCLNDAKMPEINAERHANCVTTTDAQKTTYTFTTDGWTMQACVHKSGYISVRRFQKDSVRHYAPMMACQEVPTKKRRIM